MLFMPCVGQFATKSAQMIFCSFFTKTNSTMASVASFTTQRSKPCFIIQHKHTGFVITVPQRGILAPGYFNQHLHHEFNQRRHNEIRLDGTQKIFSWKPKIMFYSRSPKPAWTLWNNGKWHPKRKIWIHPIGWKCI